jgi:mannitol 2-dehydrogenase
MSALAIRRPRLREATLRSHLGNASVPTYDRRALVPSIVHIGVGGFHRSHQACYLDRLAERTPTRGWGVVAVGLRRRHVLDALAAQDGLYTLVERDAAGDSARVVGSIARCLYGPDDPRAVLAALADPRTRIVTLTITDGAYDVDQADGPITVFDYLVEALERRRRSGLRPFTILSCDNMPNNGQAARTAVLSLARRRSASLARWIAENVAFPSSMVDRITPGATEDDRRAIAESLGLTDEAPVVTEPFTQWIVEDSFCDGRPPLEDVGVQFVDDVEPYTLMKTRLLNASHSAIGYLGHLAGYDRIDEALADPIMRDYVEQLMGDEVAPLLPDVPGIDLARYQDTLIERFGNPQICDRLTRLCRRGSAKVPAYLLPSIREARRAGRPHELLTLAVAGWLRYLRGVDGEGRPFDVEDGCAERLRALAPAPFGDPRPILHQHDLFGDLGRDPRFCDSIRQGLATIDRDGVDAALRAALDDEFAHAVAA